MLQKSGNNIFKDFIVLTVHAKNTADEINKNINKSLFSCIDAVKNTNGIYNILSMELILLQNFDINIYNNNENKIDNRVILCNIALEEYELFTTDKEKYLKKVYERNAFNPKDIDIKKDTLFEQSVKKLIINLGNEKNSCAVSPQIIELYEIRQKKLKEICQEFTLMRQNFLVEYMK